MFRCTRAALLAVPLLFPCFASPAQPDLSGLPVWTGGGEQVAQEDWLIRKPAIEAAVYRSDDGRDLILANGLIKRSWRIEPNAACFDFQNLVNGQQLLRAVRPEAEVAINGATHAIGGLTGQPNHAYLTEEWLDAMEADPTAFRFAGFSVSEPAERFAWKRVRHAAPGAEWPPRGVHLRMDYTAPDGAAPAVRGVEASVHYEMYNGIPALCKWIEVRNKGDETVTLSRFSAEILAAVEEASHVEAREGVPLPKPSMLHVETDFAFGGFNHEEANRHAVHWRTDPEYATQVNYLRLTPCLLVVEPAYGPAQDLAPGGSFESFRVFELVYDGYGRERRGLALRRMYRAVSPWVTENPLMHHMRLSGPDEVRRAIGGAAEVGFEMIILSFGSGFDIENEDPEYIATWRDIAQYARDKGVEIGGYSLLSSRRIGGGNDIVSPPGSQPTHGNCPALTSEWGLDYFRKLRAFFGKTGFTLLEHDGSYPGDVDVTPRPPLQKGVHDSRWAQWSIIEDFYQWCRGRGIYLNVPDYYFLTGSNKCGMGYRETNWSLPREQQLIHTRQNIYDGTWTKTPSMGWMFVPLTEYHGGGAAATIEPLGEHLDHYENMIFTNLAMGVQACYRGPRLFDTDETKRMVKSWVDWYKERRDILESDVIHGRRADGHGIDWMLHANPELDTPGLLAVFNPLANEAEQTIRLDVYYTGLTDAAAVSREGAEPARYDIARDYTLELPVRVPAHGFAWYEIRRAE